MRQTKILATVGPATDNEQTLRELIDAGVDVFRLNFSHGTHDSHRASVERIRAMAAGANRVVSILQDLSGPKIRTGTLQHGDVELVAGEEFRIAAGDFAGDRHRVSTTYADLPAVVSAGDTLLLDDGRIQLRVESSDGREVRTVVVYGGKLAEHKGINAPGVSLPVSGLTAKDAEDLIVGVRLGVDLVAISFVESADDLRRVREALAAEGAGHVPVIAKLERSEAVARLDEILAASDAVMVARGDLGLEIPLEQVPGVQKEITAKARRAAIPVIVATQVLESMRHEPRPTRAEVSDAANAVDEGVDAIMLAGETAVGRYPVRAVQTLDAIIRAAEHNVLPRVIPVDQIPALAGHGRAICEAAVTLAQRGDAQAIVAMTRGGKTARMLSALRPSVPIYGATDKPDVAHRLALSWGVTPIVADLSGDVDTAAARIGELLVQRGAVPRSGVIVVASINPDLARGPSNFLKLQRV